MPQQVEVSKDYSQVPKEFFALAEVAWLKVLNRGSVPRGGEEEFQLVRRVGHGLEIAHALAPAKPCSEWTFEELSALGDYRMGQLKVAVPVPTLPPTPADRLVQYGRAITIEELVRELGGSLSSIAKRQGVLYPCFHVCSCLRFCPVTIARSIQTVFTRVDGFPSLIDHLIACDHGMDAEELKVLFHVDYKTIMKAKDEGTLPFYREGSLVRFNGRAVARWLRVQMYGEVQPGITLDLPESSKVPPRRPPKG
jgi:hypothetical protein